MENRNGFVLLLTTGILQSALLLAECAPLSYSDTTGEARGGVSVAHLSLAVSLGALAAMLVLLLNCMSCCKERQINFKEFEDNFDDEVDFTPPAEDTPSMQSPAEVYTLAVPPVALPGPAQLQPPPPRGPEVSAGSQVARHTLSYIQEIGNGWFGKVLLSEVYREPGVARVVVKELKANASAKEQNDFLQHGDAYRVLQHPNILQCLGQCVEAIPFLLVFEYCEMGDLRSYLSEQDWMFGNAELLQLQKMACEMAAGVTHLHKHNFLHSDLALRNCYLTADLTVRVGDYGIGPYRFKEDYIITEDEVAAPLRWLAPELVGERHGGVVTLEQTKPGNVWALGVALWELFENAAQPYPHLSDREVLNHVIKEQQIKLFKPQLELPYSDRWYEVLQFCWLSPDKRATAEEVHRLLTYLRMQGQKEVEDDFEQRWDSLKPNPSARQTTASHSSFPILEQFADDALRPEIDEVLTVTETSRGLSFEYVWEAAKHDHYDGSHGRAAMDTTLNYHSMFFPLPSEDIQARFPDPAARPGGGEAGIPGMLPVFDAQKLSSRNEYFIQLEEQGDGKVQGNDDTGSDRHEFVTLQDVRLDESSTDAEFFHRSIDSKDSFLQDSHIWSSSEHESPYNNNIFSESDSKQEDSHSWKMGLMELPQRSGNSFQEAAPEVMSQWEDRSMGDHFLGSRSEGHRPEGSREMESPDVMRLLNTEKLVDNFTFLTDRNLIKESSGSSGRNGTLQQDFLQPGLAHAPEDSFKMSSWDDLVTLGGSNVAETHNPTAPKEEPLDFMDPSFVDFLQPLVVNETLVPSITLATETSFSNQQPVRNGSSSDHFGLVHSSGMGIDPALDAASDRAEVPDSPATSYQSSVLSESATIDSLCTDAKTADLEDRLGPSKDSAQSVGIEEPADSPSSPSAQDDSVAPIDYGHSEGLTSDDVLSELIDDTEVEMDAVFSDHDEPLEDDGAPPVGSPLLTLDPSMDQISQDSLLDDSVSTTLPTVENSACTPDSLDSLDIHRLEGRVAPHKLQPPYKTADSGYETENLESPEWNSQPIGKEHPAELNGVAVPEPEEEGAAPAAALALVPPEIIVSEVGSVPEAQDEENDLDGPQPDLMAPGGEPFMGGNYRDSAYFSDNESEPEKKSEEPNGGSSAEVSWLRSSPTEISVATGGASAPAGHPEEADLRSPQEEPLTATESLVDVGEEHSELLTQGDNGLPELVLTGEDDWEKEVSVSLDGNEERLESFPDIESSAQPEDSEPSEDPATSPSTDTSSAKPSPENMVHAKLTRTYASDGPKLKEPDMEGRYLGRRDGSGTDGQEDGVEADEEDDNSDEDSDDDMRAYRLHSSSSESEDDTVHPVPIIVSDDSSVRNLKSLLKPNSPNIAAKPSSPPEGSDANNDRRAVSFFDDVTVYLFDQETPTKELGDHGSGSNSQTAEFSPVPAASYLNRFTNSESSTDEEGGGFEWDDDFSPEPSYLSRAARDLAQAKPPASSAASRYFSPPPAGRAPEPSWASSSSSYSRFSISPASIASFSLTHLTDSDIEQGGSSEDGDKD